MQVAILHNAVTAAATADERDVLVQRDAVAQSLQRLGHEPVTVPCTLDLEALRQALVEMRPDCVVNLVEALGGSDWLMFLPSALLDTLQLPYTGSPTQAILQTTHKTLAKERMSAAGLPTPAWIDGGRRSSQTEALGALSLGQHPANAGWIVKAVWEHASLGLDDDSLCSTADTGSLAERVRERTVRTGRQHFAERYVSGREFNLSLLSNGVEVRVLPPAEIDFSAFPPDKPAIVGYRAKWDEASDEYQQTPRLFEFFAQDQGLLAKLKELSIACWRLFGLRGYARVDFRVDPNGQPWILEVNANPCLSPDAGFAAALARQGMRFDNAMAQILAAAMNQEQNDNLNSLS